MDSIANPHLNSDPGAIMAFPGEAFGLSTAYTTSILFSLRHRETRSIPSILAAWVRF
jgi:hypothetical protein